MEEAKKPWEMNKDLVDIITAYSATVVGEKDKNNYYIEFYDYDGTLVEATLEKEKFHTLPYPIGKGTRFWIVQYVQKECGEEGIVELGMDLWPIKKGYWHESW